MAPAARGMPYTALDASSWPIVRPPTAAMASRPRAPSSPMPVRITPIAVRLRRARRPIGTARRPTGGGSSRAVLDSSLALTRPERAGAGRRDRCTRDPARAGLAVLGDDDIGNAEHPVHPRRRSCRRTRGGGAARRAPAPSSPPARRGSSPARPGRRWSRRRRRRVVRSPAAASRVAGTCRRPRGWRITTTPLRLRTVRRSRAASSSPIQWAGLASAISAPPATASVAVGERSSCTRRRDHEDRRRRVGHDLLDQVLPAAVGDQRGRR